MFEISEQESIRNFDVFREVRDEYGKLGFQFALDDTGAGYASLQSVLELEPDFIKVDRAFVQGIDQDPARQKILRALDPVASGSARASSARASTRRPSSRRCAASASPSARAT